jgi:hypothetical protein
MNGDPIALDLETGTMGFVHHDVVWEDPEAPPRESYIATPFDLGSFFLAAALFAYPDDHREKSGERFFPVDAYDAETCDPADWVGFFERIASFEADVKAADERDERAWDAWYRGAFDDVEKDARASLATVLPDRLRSVTRAMVAWVQLARGDVPAARTELAAFPPDRDPADVQSLAIALLEGDATRARGLVAKVDPTHYHAWRPMLAHWRQAGRRDLLERFAAPDCLTNLPVDMARSLAEHLFHVGAFDASARLLASLYEGQRDTTSQDAYNLACVEGRRGRAAVGLVWLERALVLGFADWALMNEDADLAPVRALDGYAAMIARHARAD